MRDALESGPHPDVGLDPQLDPERASYFVSRITLHLTGLPGMAAWRKRLFIALAHNAPSSAEFLCLPQGRTIVLSPEVDA